MKQAKKILIMLFLFWGFSINVLADTSIENIELARINSVLDSVYPLINAAQQQAELNSRLKFHYDWLKKDFQEIQAGIAQKINNASIEPRPVKPLKNSFIEQQNSKTKETKETNGDNK